jgi:hypothetical protein
MISPIRNTEQQLDHIYYTLFCRCTAALLSLLPATTTCGIMQSQNHFPEPNRHKLDFLHPFSLCRITYWAPLEMLLDNFENLTLWNWQQQKNRTSWEFIHIFNLFSRRGTHLFIGVLLARCMDKKCPVSEHWDLGCLRGFLILVLRYGLFGCICQQWATLACDPLVHVFHFRLC